MRLRVVGVLAICVAIAFAAPAFGATRPDPTRTPGLAASDYYPSAACASTTTVSTVKIPKAITTKTWKRYRVSEGHQRRFRLDLLVPAVLGGLPDAKNVWPLPASMVAAKRAAEKAVVAHVCAGEVTLADAQRWFATDWTTSAQSADQRASEYLGGIAFLAAVDQQIHEALANEWAEAEARLQADTAAAAASTQPSTPGSRIDRIPRQQYVPAPTPDTEFFGCRKIGFVWDGVSPLPPDAVLGPMRGPNVCPPGYEVIHAS